MGLLFQLYLDIKTLKSRLLHLKSTNWDPPNFAQKKRSNLKSYSQNVAVKVDPQYSKSLSKLKTRH